MESFATGLKRIKDACDKAGCKVEFETPADGFVVVFYRHGTQKLSGTAQKDRSKNAQKEERINTLLEYCKEPKDRDEMMKFLGIKHRTTFRNNYLNPLLNEEKIVMSLMRFFMDSKLNIITRNQNGITVENKRAER